MKKVFSLMLLLATMLTFAACGGDDDKDEPKNSLKGTVWTSTYTDNVIVLDFTGENTVEFYGADMNLNQSGKTYYGTYTQSGNDVKFSLECAWYEKMVMKSAVINGNSMEVTYDHNMGIIDDWRTDARTFRKRQ